MQPPQVAIIVESYNATEHSSVDRLAGALAAATRAASRHGDAKVVLSDSGGDPAVERLVAERFPEVERFVPASGHYDVAKAETAEATGTEIVAFLDGDCIPTDDGWLDALVAPIAAGETVASAGFTQYEGGWFSDVQSVMDFGFLLPRRPRPVGCFASNNVAFRTEALVRTPAPGGPMRCMCFAQAQLFERQGEPIQLAPAATARHEQVPLIEERLRRGWDLVEAARVDPDLPEARWLRLGVRAAPLFLLDNIRLDIRRALRSGGDIGLGLAGRLAAVPTMVALRAIDLVGVVAALRGRPVPGTG